MYELARKRGTYGNPKDSEEMLTVKLKSRNSARIGLQKHKRYLNSEETSPIGDRYQLAGADTQGKMIFPQK
jgi:hypothetical protein